jgi:hypothetical protein
MLDDFDGIELPPEPTFDADDWQASAMQELDYDLA